MKVTSTPQLQDHIAADSKRAAESADELRDIIRQVAVALPHALAWHGVPDTRAAELRDLVVSRLRSMADAHAVVVETCKDAANAINELVAETKKPRRDEPGFRI